MVSEIKVSIIIPAYNEEKCVGVVLRQLLMVSKDLPSSEIIVVDDGSTDRTAKEVVAFPAVKYVVHEKNQGKGADLLTGFEPLLVKFL